MPTLDKDNHDRLLVAVAKDWLWPDPGGQYTANRMIFGGCFKVFQVAGLFRNRWRFSLENVVTIPNFAPIALQISAFTIALLINASHKSIQFAHALPIFNSLEF
jgi:hypothetical protein